MKVVPAILTSDIKSFWDQINKLSPFYDHFHIDILDGTNYGNNKTVSIEDIFNTSSEHKELIKKIALDIHFMIKSPDYLSKNVLDLKSQININCLYFHYKISPNIQLLYDALGIEIGLAIDSDDSIDEISKKYDLKELKNITIMTITPGAQEQAFLEYPLNKIEQLENLGYRYNISVDGGINDLTLPIVLSKKYQPNFLNIGSFFSKSMNIDQSVKKINSIIQAFSK